MIIGITGGIGSGKSTVVKLFAKQKNIAVYIADKEAKKLMNSSKEIKQKLINIFSKNVYKDNKLNRSFLANIVFKDKKKLKILNEIVHPIVYRHLQLFVKKNKNKDYILYENAILFENGNNTFCSKIITVTAPESIRIIRVTKRDKTTEENVKNRIKNQWSDAKKILQSHYIIDNIELKKTEEKVNRLHNLMLLNKTKIK